LIVSRAHLPVCVVHRLDVVQLGHCIAAGSLSSSFGSVTRPWQAFPKAAALTTNVGSWQILLQSPVRCTISGVIRGVTVTLQSSSHVEGDMLAIEQAAEFDGPYRRSADPSELKMDLGA
jgi:hypothetical protein